VTPSDAVDECRRAFAEEAPAWPAPLIRFLDQPPNLQRVFAWVLSCTRRLLALLEEATPNLDQQLALLQSYVENPPDIGVIRGTLEQLWVQRSPHETAKIAVVQLFGALIRYLESDTYRHLACTVSITILVDAALDRKWMFEIVIQDFMAVVSG
jgi:hypothetical protein